MKLNSQLTLRTLIASAILCLIHFGCSTNLSRHTFTADPEIISRVKSLEAGMRRAQVIEILKPRLTRSLAVIPSASITEYYELSPEIAVSLEFEWQSVEQPLGDDNKLVKVTESLDFIRDRMWKPVPWELINTQK